ncbi:MAG TPA: MerR family DNA-binding transcriptional regulator [Acidimicrobiia bacterium]|nr:MerR family DNA-binding transcriptional regulator [Acidimicrobiia bacterium]
MASLRISELADAVGIAPSTVRYYERIGLVPEPERTASGYRVYTREAEARLRFIVRGKRLGLSLEQIGELLGVWNGENCAATQEHLRRFLDEKQTQITADIAELQSFSAQLRDVQQQLATTAPPGACTPELDCCAPAIADASAGGTAGEPIACMLDATGIEARLAEFADVFRGALVGRDATADGIRFRFANVPGREEAIRDLARREQSCCSFFRFDIALHGDEVWWDAAVDDPKARPLLDDFLALPDQLGVAARRNT